MTTEVEPVHLTTAEAAAYLGIGRRKLLRLAHAGDIPCAWLGERSPRYPRWALDEWMERETLRKHRHAPVRLVRAGE